MLTAPGQPTGLAAAAVPAAHRLTTATSGPSPLWYATRATGETALVLLTITVALGIAGVSRLESRHWPRVIFAAVIPFTSGYRTFWLGLGAIAFDLILALVITSLLRGRLSYRAWRAVH